MEYIEQVLDRSTGDMITRSIGNWITITELGQLYAVGPRTVRTILRNMDFLYVEGGRAHNRHRLTPWVVARSYGKHIPGNPATRLRPFDVVSPEGQAWIEGRWSNTIRVLAADAGGLIAQARDALQAFKDARGRHSMTVQECVSWLRHHYPKLSHAEIGSILDVTQQLVSRYVGIATKQADALKRRRDRQLDETVKLRLSLEHFDEAMASGGTRYIT